MRVQPASIPDVLVIEPDVHGDARGFFQETWNADRYDRHGIPVQFRQDCISSSSRGVLRGLHIQFPRMQGKLVFVLRGEVFDIVVDLRRSSPTFGRWVGHTLSAENHRQLWIPPGFGHGFLVTSEDALFVYKATEAYDAAGQVAVCWNDPDLGVEWPAHSPRLSERDARAPRLRDIDPSHLPD